MAKVGPDLARQIKARGNWVAKQQFRLKDGTLARERPQAVSLWADDMFMGVPALAELGRMTGERAYVDDAVKSVLQMSGYMFYTHGWNANHPDAPQFYRGRANGWAALSMSYLLDVLPKDHPGYPRVLEQLRRSLKGIAQLQSGTGLWHQMLDRNDSCLETSAGAIFTYVFAHAVNEGWISPTTYDSIALAAWAGLWCAVRPGAGAPWKVLANGPVRAVFELAYDGWDAAGTRVTEVKRFTVDAGHQLDVAQAAARAQSPVKVSLAR